MSKYYPLARHLQGLKSDRWTAGFAEIEKILGFALPASARKYNAWWANQAGGGHSQSSSWQSVGWQTAEPDFHAKTVKFVRNRRTDFQTLAPSQAAPPKPPAPIAGEAGSKPTPMLTIEEAKAGLSNFYGIPIEQIEITIRG